jgi:hypothetical protein
MSELSQPDRVVAFLREYPDKKFTAREIAKEIVQRHPEDYVEKRQNPKYFNDVDNSELIRQVSAEIGASKNNLLKKEPYLSLQDKPRPRKYWFDPNKLIVNNREKENLFKDAEEEENKLFTQSILTGQVLTEEDLYPLLINYLKSTIGLYCLRINEKRSKNKLGAGANKWLHPDIVAMETKDTGWHESIRECVKHGAGGRVRLLSFEVKKKLSMGNVREYFFQAVSNSTWANEGYLVTAEIADSNVEYELRMLSSLHGIGIILLDTENPSESEIFLPAKPRLEVDWESVNRIVSENQDFNDYMDKVSIYYQTGKINNLGWNKI